MCEEGRRLMKNLPRISICNRLTLSAFMLALSGAGVTGCSGDQGHATVAGTVTLDEKPLESGLIRFIPSDGQSPTADAPIAAGKYTAKVPLGEKRVEISAPKVVGTQKMYNTPDARSMDIVDELLPARYNAQSELTITVTEEDQQHDFELKSDM